MAESRGLSLPCGRDTVYIDTNRILDSCRDKDCFEDVVVYLSDAEREAIEHGCNVRTKSAEIVSAQMTVDPVPFNRGFYQISIKMFVRVVCEVCSGMGKIQEIDGLCIVEKKVVLYGSEGNISIFRSSGGSDGFCGRGVESSYSSNLPTAVLEVADPIVLSTKIVDGVCGRGTGCICDGELPQAVAESFKGRLGIATGGRYLVVSLGFFSVVRIERPAQYLVSGAEYTVPEKECLSPVEDDPCSMFRRMAFPTGEFYPPSLSDLTDAPERGHGEGGCGCKK